MQAMPDARQQSFEEIYGAPENFLEIEVCSGDLVYQSIRSTYCALQPDVSVFLSGEIPDL